MRKTRKKPKRFKRFIVTLLVAVIAIPLAWIAFSLVGRVEAASLIPDAYTLRLRIHNPVRLVDGILAHESLPEIAGNAALESALPVINTIRKNGLFENHLVRFAARGSFEGALLEAGKGQGKIIAAWDSGFASPLLRFLPFFSRFITVPDLYYVQAGKLSRFEYRLNDGVFYIGPRRNLLVICNDRQLFETLMGGGVSGGSPKKTEDPSALDAADFDAVALFSPSWLAALFAGDESGAAAVMKHLEFSGFVEAGLVVSSNKVDVRLRARAGSSNPAFRKLLDRRSPSPELADRLPAATQYSTILSAGTLAELYAAAGVFSDPELAESMRRADSSARLFLNLSLDDILFSWTGGEFAVFGLEGRPHPVYAVQIENEQKRREVFDKAFKTIVLNENVQLNLDGMRIPRIEVPDFLQALLRRWDLRIPSPYYTVYNGCLFASESAETLLAAVRAMQKNDVLPKTASWRNLSRFQSDASAFGLYYSLDRSLPFFLRGKAAVNELLRLYRQGLVRMSFDRGIIDIALSVVPGSGRGLALMNGYPLALGGNPGNRVYGVIAGKANENRILLSRDGSAIAVNAADNHIYELEGPWQGSRQGQSWILPAEGLAVKSAADAAAWVVSAQGRVALVNANMEPVWKSPLSTGLRLYAAPAAFEGKLFLCDEQGKVHIIDASGGISEWGTVFAAALRSPPSFLSLPKGGSYAAVYPKSFFGEIWLLDSGGKALPNWPVPVSGIAFGSPLLFAHNNRLRTAFVTQAGELSLFDENAAMLPYFPVQVEGIFYVQPVFDGDYLWLVSADGTLFRIGLEGEILYQRIPNFQVMEEGCLMLFDADGDKIPEIFVSGEGNALHGYSRNFRSLEGFPLPVWGRPLFGNLGGGEKGECTGIGMDKQLYRWQFR